MMRMTLKRRRYQKPAQVRNLVVEKPDDHQSTGRPCTGTGTGRPVCRAGIVEVRRVDELSKSSDAKSGILSGQEIREELFRRVTIRR